MSKRRLSVTQRIMQDVDAKLKAKNYPNHKTYRQFCVTAMLMCSIAAVAVSFDGVKLKDINKPVRHTAEYTRGRKEPFAPQKSRDLENEAWREIVEFNLRVGLRKNELKKLKGSNFKRDESGHWAVEVLRGKAGKYTLNRMQSDEDVEFIRKYFEGKEPDEPIFSPEMFNNHLICIS